MMTTFNDIFKDAGNKITGIAAAPGLVIAKAYKYIKEELEVNGQKIINIKQALSDLDEAIARSKKELKKILNLARDIMGDKRAIIFEAQMMILDDPILLGTIKRRIEYEKMLPEFIVDDEISKYQKLMLKAHEGYMSERAHDIEDIKNRIIRNLQNKRWISKITHDVIVVSDTLTPSDTILFSRSDTKGFVTDRGGLTSHAAIISRSLNIPAVVGTHNSTLLINDGDELIVDGFHGCILVNPTKKQRNFYNTKIKHLKELQKNLIELKDKKAETTDGKIIELLANVDVTGEIDIAKTTGAQGIGLYRSEQILAEMGDLASEEEQAEIYNKLASRMYPQMVTIRALDIGGDKFNFSEISEPNPFLGLRGIRLLLANESLFKSQIRAVLRASKNKNIQFMLPMVSSLLEVRESKKLIDECKKELKKAKKEFDNNIKIGIMIEVPSSALLAKEFADEVDFLSIGTNDLIQYLVAVDRGNDLVSDLYREFHPAVLRTLKIIVDGGKTSNKNVSICGEMAAETLAIPLLIGLGLETLSLSPATIPYIKKIIRSISYSKSKKLADECLTYKTSDEIKARIEKFFVDNSIKRTRNII